MRYLIFLIFLSTALCADEKALARRVEASLLIGDPLHALAEAKKALEECPQSPLLHKMWIKSLSACGHEGEMMGAWEALKKQFPDECMEDSLLEEMCFGILNKGCHASHLPIRLIALIAFALTEDVRAVQVLRETMRDSNATFRSLAVELASFYGDQTLQDDIAELFTQETSWQEKSWQVRESQYAAIAKLKMTHLKPTLLDLLKGKGVSAQEKAAIIQTIKELKQSVEHIELELLVNSNWSDLRVLAAKLIEEESLEGEIPFLEKLMQDSHVEVKKAALSAWGALRLHSTEIIENLARSNTPDLAISASWVMIIDGKKEGEEILKRWLESEKSEERILAAGAITKAGFYGIELAKVGLKKAKDPLVRANLALALIKQRVQVEESCGVIDTFLKEHREQLMWREGFFTPLQKSTVKHVPAINNYPEAVNQVVRLEILNLLAIVEYPQAQLALKEFLKVGRWEVVGLAAENLLECGDDAAIALVEGLLNDKDEKISLNAALLLANWGGGEERALELLLKAYPKKERREKIKILEALGACGERKTIPFLIDQLKEPSQTLRIIAACVLIQTLHH